MKQILLFSIIFGLSSCGPKPEDVHVHVHLNMSEIQKEEFGGHGMKTSHEFDFPGNACGVHCSCNKWECREAAHCVWLETSQNWNQNGMCKKSKRECDIEYDKNTNCRGSCNK